MNVSFAILWFFGSVVWCGSQPCVAQLQPTSEAPATRSLRSDLTPTQLRQVLAGVERDLATAITSGPGADPAEQFETVRRVVDLKRQASQRLADHPQATQADAATGRRGLLQSESHLASLGRLDAAKRLEALATKYRSDPSPAVRADAATVRVGLAIERLQNGGSGAAEALMSAVNDLQSTGEALDIAALVSFGQAFQTFERYDDPARASRVAAIIEAEFANDADPQVQSMAQTIIGRGPLVDLQRDRAAILQGDELFSVTQWQRTLGRVWQNADLPTVRLLANVALELEAFDRERFAAATYDVLRDADLAALPPVVASEVRGVLRAADARTEIVGQTLSLDLPTVSGQPVDLDLLRGKLLIVPFWSSQFPASIEPLWTESQELRRRYDDRVAVVGVNLDTGEFDPDEFLTRRGWDLPSWRAVSDPTAAVINETAQRFGVSSLVYVLLIDGTGKIRKVNLSGEGLTEQVTALLDEI